MSTFDNPSTLRAEAYLNLKRLAEAAGRLATHLATTQKLSDPEDELTHMQANLDHVKGLLQP